MDTLATVLTTIETLAKYKALFTSTWNDLKPFATDLYTQLSGGAAPTVDQQTEMEARIDALAARLQEPLPAARPGDPDYPT